MNTVSELRQHAQVVEETRKITRAMYLISSAKMKKAARLKSSHSLFFDKVRSDMRYMLEHAGAKFTDMHYIEQGKNAGYVVIAGDKGLCGDYNTAVCALAEKAMADGGHERKALYTIGHMADEYFARRGMDPDVHYDYIIQDPRLQHARAITAELMEMYKSRKLDEVYVIYTRHRAGGAPSPGVMRLLPVLPEDLMDAPSLGGGEGDMEFYPSVNDVLSSAVPHYLVGLFYSALVESYASEQYARMAAMENATRSADELLESLKLQMNHARQALITQEISEILSGTGSL